MQNNNSWGLSNAAFGLPASQVIKYRFRVENIGDVPLENVYIKDPLLQAQVYDYKMRVSSLLPGQVYEVDRWYTPKGTGAVVNTATVEGTPKAPTVPPGSYYPLALPKVMTSATLTTQVVSGVGGLSPLIGAVQSVTSLGIAAGPALSGGGSTSGTCNTQSGGTNLMLAPLGSSSGIGCLFGVKTGEDLLRVLAGCGV